MSFQSHHIAQRVSLRNYLNTPKPALPTALCQLIETLAHTCQHISQRVKQGALGGVLGSAGTGNVQGETQQKLDVLANQMLVDAFSARALSPCVAGMASEEMEAIYTWAHRQNGDYLLLFDPLDGSSNIDVNMSIGTIFSVLNNPAKAENRPLATKDFLQPGHSQVAAGYCLYGPQTTLVLSLGQGVAMFTLDSKTDFNPTQANSQTKNSAFILTTADIKISESTQEFAINMSNMRHWDAPVKRYVEECLAGTEGPRGKNFNMRWVASMVADVHRILCRGGVFLYPWDKREPNKPGKLRLLYEANPMAFLIEQAGGMAINGQQNILTLAPTQLHERVGVMLGAKEEVRQLLLYHSSQGA